MGTVLSQSEYTRLMQVAGHRVKVCIAPMQIVRRLSYHSKQCVDVLN